MTSGQHYAEFTLLSRITKVGVVVQSAAGRILDTFCAGDDESWAYDVYHGGCLKTQRDGDVKDIAWVGQDSANRGDRIGLLLDLGDGSIVVYKNDIRLGTMAPPGTIRGPVCWYVSGESGGCGAKIEAKPVPR